uniref:CTP synthase n=1 Tax=Amazona collaria TaxID=241587 RepID=A0A8B9FAZ9_9PSIT
MKYILVTGGVISGIGKGIIASSIGTILKSCGLRVTAIKIDPYINIDAGTFSPYEHGEVFVLNDGGEVDLDLGNYERFLDINLYKDNNITTGKIYQHVINKERHGDYLVPQPNATGEQKTKPTQNSVRALRGLGLSPDLVMFYHSESTLFSLKPLPLILSQQALEHSALAINHKLDLMYIDSTELECSTEAENSVKYHQAWHKVKQMARTKKKPFLGVCLGMQLAVVEFARNCLNWEDANSTEFDPDTKNPVVIDMPEHNPGDMGGTMRLGKRKTVFKTQNSVLRKLYGDEMFVEERHRHRYEVNPELTHCFEEKGLKFVGHDTEENRMEIIELESECLICL